MKRMLIMNTNKLKSTLTTALFTCAIIASAILPVTYASQDIETKAQKSEAKVKTAKSVGRVKSNVNSKSATQQSATNENAPKGIEHKGNLNNINGKSKTFTNTKTDKSHHDVWIDTVDIDILEDPNHNGYYNRIIVDFDADTHYSSIEVYAELALTDSNGLTTTYFTTDDFYLWGESYSDDYEVDTVLTTNWIADEYDLTISIYDAYTHNLVAHLDDYDSSALANLPLESVDNEYQADHHLSVFSAQSWLIDDNDSDGFYQSFSMDLDIDNNYGSSNVYAEVFISADSVNWESLYISEHFIINENDTSDKFSMEFDLASGFAADYYNVQVQIIDANTHMTMLTIEPSSYSALYALPLEDSYNDTVNQTPPPQPSNPVRTSVSTQSGGSMGILSLTLLGGLLFVRQFTRRKL